MSGIESENAPSRAEKAHPLLKLALELGPLLVFFFVLFNLIVDVLYAVVDPRIRAA